MRTRAIIIKKQHTGEYDQLVTCYTEEFGKLTAIAKSVLKPHSKQAMQLNPLNLVDFELVEGHAAPIITAAQTERAYPSLRSSLVYMAVANFFLEAADKIIYDRDRDAVLWDFLTGLLNDLDCQGSRTLALSLFRRKQEELLGILGYAGRASDIPAAASHSPLDALFEQIAQVRFHSLPLLYDLAAVVE